MKGANPLWKGNVKTQCMVRGFYQHMYNTNSCPPGTHKTKTSAECKAISTNGFCGSSAKKTVWGQDTGGDPTKGCRAQPMASCNGKKTARGNAPCKWYSSFPWSKDVNNGGWPGGCHWQTCCNKLIFNTNRGGSNSDDSPVCVCVQAKGKPHTRHESATINVMLHCTALARSK